MFPDDLAVRRVHCTQHTNVRVELALDAEALAEIGGTLLVGDVFGPVVFRPVVRRDVEQLGVLVVGHGHPVRTAEEVRRDLNGLALGFALGRSRRTLTFDFHRTARSQIPALGPADVRNHRIDAECGAGLLGNLAVAGG